MESKYYLTTASHTASLWPFLQVKYDVRHPNKTTDKIIISFILTLSVSESKLNEKTVFELNHK